MSEVGPIYDCGQGFLTDYVGLKEDCVRFIRISPLSYLRYSGNIGGFPVWHDCNISFDGEVKA